MSDEANKPSEREQLEERVIALLFGELDDEAAKAIAERLERDEELRVFRERMEATLGLVKEASHTPDLEKEPVPQQLSNERREALLAEFKVVSMPQAKEKGTPVGRIAVIAAAIVLLGALVPMFLPALAKKSSSGLAISAIKPSTGVDRVEMVIQATESEGAQSVVSKQLGEQGREDLLPAGEQLFAGRHAGARNSGQKTEIVLPDLQVPAEEETVAQIRSGTMVAKADDYGFAAPGRNVRFARPEVNRLTLGGTITETKYRTTLEKAPVTETQSLYFSTAKESSENAGKDFDASGVMDLTREVSGGKVEAPPRIVVAAPMPAGPTSDSGDRLRQRATGQHFARGNRLKADFQSGSGAEKEMAQLEELRESEARHVEPALPPVRLEQNLAGASFGLEQQMGNSGVARRGQLTVVGGREKARHEALQLRIMPLQLDGSRAAAEQPTTVSLLPVIGSDKESQDVSGPVAGRAGARLNAQWFGTEGQKKSISSRSREEGEAGQELDMIFLDVQAPQRDDAYFDDSAKTAEDNPSDGKAAGTARSGKEPQVISPATYLYSGTAEDPFGGSTKNQEGKSGARGVIEARQTAPLRKALERDRAKSTSREDAREFDKKAPDQMSLAGRALGRANRPDEPPSPSSPPEPGEPAVMPMKRESRLSESELSEKSKREDGMEIARSRRVTVERKDMIDDLLQLRRDADEEHEANRKTMKRKHAVEKAPASTPESMVQKANLAPFAPALQSAKPKPTPTPVKRSRPKTLKPKPEIATRRNAFSTFSLNVSDVAFKLAKASLDAGKLPNAETVRSEEFLNAFDYHDPAPVGSRRVSLAWNRARNPFAHDRDLLRFSIQTAARGRAAGQPLNLVVLLDASGSMERADRERIVAEMLGVLVKQLQKSDKISVVSFARTPRLLIDGMSGGQPDELLRRVTGQTPEGGTNIEAALATAYEIARRHYLPMGNNRVILLTDGAANLGDVNPATLRERVEAERKQGVALDCFGVGWEGYNDDLLESLSRNGDGRYGFVNDPAEARNGFADLLAGSLQVAAADVKAQVEFNPGRVIAWRQIGYDKHQLTKQQFRDNTVDAAEIGAAESGTALYSIQVKRDGVGPLGVVRVRFRVPATGEYIEEQWELDYSPEDLPLASASPAMRLAAVATGFAEWLTANPFAGSVTLRDLEQMLNGVPAAFANDPRPTELAKMISQARRLVGE